MTAYLIANPPARSQFRRPRRQTPSGVIVLHTAENGPDFTPPDTGAERVAQFIRGRSEPGSYHDLCDSDSTINLVPYDAEAFHDGTGTNPHSLSISLATQAHRWPTKPVWWRDAAIDQAAQAAARQARFVKAQTGVDIPARRITAAQARDRQPGFTTHAELDPSRRSDPGRGFPWALFLDRYRHHLGAAPAPVPAPPPVAPVSLEDPMFLILDGVGFFAVVNGAPVGLSMQQYADAHGKSKGVPVLRMDLGQRAGERYLGSLLRKHAAQIEGTDAARELLTRAAAVENGALRGD